MMRRDSSGIGRDKTPHDTRDTQDKMYTRDTRDTRDKLTKLSSVLLLPIVSVESSLFIDPLVCVGSELISLCLDKIRRQAFRAECVEICEGGRKTRGRDAVLVESNDHFSQPADTRIEQIGKRLIKH